MATKSVAEKFREEIYPSEAYLTGLFWSHPELYDSHSTNDLNRQTFTNSIWGFFFGLGRFLSDSGVKIFDDITVYKYVTDMNVNEKYKEYGGYQTIQEISKEVKGKFDNVDAYLREVKKYEMVRYLHGLFGDKVLTEEQKYNYHIMNKDQIYNFWLDKINRVALQESKFEEANLLDGLKEALDEWDKDPSVGLEFFDSKRMTETTCGWDYGHIYIYGSFGGRGKTSFTFNKVVMSCITNQEPLLIIANEQDIEDFQKMLLITTMGNITKPEESFDRTRINEGHFTEDEREKLDEAVVKILEITEGDAAIVKFVFLNTFTMDNVRHIATYYAQRGYRSMIIDTGKPSDNLNGMQRWERFAEDFKVLYSIIRKNAGGLDMRCWVNVQLADTALNHRFLNEYAFGDSKKIKNEASVVMMGRPLRDDEFAGGSSPVEVYNWIPEHEMNKIDEFNEAKEVESRGKVKFSKHTFTLDKYYKGQRKDGTTYESFNNYYVIFTPKNRRGRDNNTGLDCIIMRADFNKNVWKEIGFASIQRDYNF